ATHNMTTDVLANTVRIGAPFLLGWLVASVVCGAYRPGLVHTPGAFVLRSLLAWLGCIVLALLLRSTVFGSAFNPVFAGISAAFTALFLLGWRGAYVWLNHR
ncbi:MAG: DUF3054 domain-containing protein, partial [Chloroflexota bacterium]|nr:DUF3054 domain-containing protein [Chloroflexota bacterium]